MNDNDMESADSDIDAGGNVFDEPSTVFTPDTPLDTMNPQVTRGQEDESQNMPGTAPPAPVRHLMFVRNAFGQMKCAWTVNGNPVEVLRDPSPEENAMAPQAQWRAIPQAQNNPQAPQAAGIVPMGRQAQGKGAYLGAVPESGGTGKMILWAAVLAGVGYAGWKALQWYEQHEDDMTDEELEDADDVDEEVSV